MERTASQAGTETRIRAALEDSARVKLAVAEAQASLIAKMAAIMVERLRSGGKVVWLGNGGSAGDAQHLAAELVSRFQRERAAIPSMSLGTNNSVLTAIGNDYGYNRVFARQVEALVTERDVVVGISTSGRSPSVLLAMAAARLKGAHCLGLTGQNGQALADACDLCLMVPSEATARIQETHISVGHVLCELVEDAFAES
jgi:D-sedoheptulose 7-phosphate isomerase